MILERDAQKAAPAAPVPERRNPGVSATAADVWRRLSASLPSTLGFVVVWAVLDAVANVRYPAGEQRFWYFFPALDVSLALGVLAVAVALRPRSVRTLCLVLAVLFVLVRLMRIADGVATQYYHRDFDAYVDLLLVPELVRLLRATLPGWVFGVFVPGLLLGLVAIDVVVYRALRSAAHWLSTPSHRLVLFVANGLVVLAVPLRPEAYPDHYSGPFAASALPRLAAQLDSFRLAPRRVARRRQELETATQRLQRVPSNLARLQGTSVFLFFIESYGQTVLDRPFYRERLRPVQTEFESALATRGVHVVSSVLDSPTFGGLSWLAHATLATGIETRDRLDYDLLLASHVRPIARFFRDAGYATVLFEPATNRAWPQSAFYGFEREHFATNLDYHGPAFGYASMPDQYVLDVVRRKELARAERPLFLQAALISSHVPWNELPPVVDDWSRIGDGSLYGRLPVTRFPVSVSDLSHAELAYVSSLAYDFEVLKEFLVRFAAADTLVILLGDHQPSAELTGGSDARGVVVHVLSCRQQFLDAFARRGYTPGMAPRSAGPHASMADFLIDFLEDFSDGPSAAAR